MYFSKITSFNLVLFTLLGNKNFPLYFTIIPDKWNFARGLYGGIGTELIQCPSLSYTYVFVFLSINL